MRAQCMLWPCVSPSVRPIRTIKLQYYIKTAAINASPRGIAYRHFIVFWRQIYRRKFNGSRSTGASNTRVWVGKVDNVRPVTRRLSETVRTWWYVYRKWIGSRYVLYQTTTLPMTWCGLNYPYHPILKFCVFFDIFWTEEVRHFKCGVCTDWL